MKNKDQAPSEGRAARRPLASNDEVVWRAAPAFGSFLRAARQQARLSIQDAARVLGTNYAHLARLERAERTAPPTRGFLARVARAYHLDLDTVLRAAGHEPARAPGTPRDEPDGTLHVRFRELVERFRPLGLDHPGPMYYSPGHRRQVLAIAAAVERRSRRSGAVPLRRAMVDRLQGTGSLDGVAAAMGTNPDAGFMVWLGDPGLGAFLRRARKQRGLALRQAAARFGISHARVSKLESHRWARPPTEKLLRRIAAAYGLDLGVVMRAAGFQESVPPDAALGIDVHDAFEWLLADLGLLPGEITRNHVEFYSAIQKQQVLDLALKVERTAGDGDDRSRLGGAGSAAGWLADPGEGR